MINLTINSIPVEVAEGTTILDAALKVGIKIPTLCYLEGVHKFGSCRICCVEVEGARTLMAACITECTEGMKVKTNTKQVQDSRKVLYELLLSDHSKNCLSCDRNQSCELQQLGDQLGIRDVRFDSGSTRNQIDTSVTIRRDLSKCILCRRCVTVCNEAQGIGILNAQHRGFDTVISPAMSLKIKDANCAMCGQCTVVCPVGALQETDNRQKVLDALADPEIRVVVQPAPAVRVALGDMFGMPVGSLVTGKMAAALRRLGFDDVFDVDWSADLTIMEEGTEFLGRVTDVLNGKPATLPMITSCSPGWIRFVEHYHPTALPHLSTCKSPHMMQGAMIKTYYAEKIGVAPDKIFVCSVMPCTAKKYEATREEMFLDGVPTVDTVITTRELGQLIKSAGIDFVNLPDEEYDEPMGFSTGAADIFGVTGGVMEAALRTCYFLITGRNISDNLHVMPIEGLDSVKKATLKLENVLPAYAAFEGLEVCVAVTSGLKGADQLLKQIEAGTSPYHFIEVMCCPGGCIAGGGQPRSSDPDFRQKRLEAIYTEDEKKTLRMSHENQSIAELYAEYLGKPGGHRSHHLLHTTYTPRGTWGVLEGDLVERPRTIAEARKESEYKSEETAPRVQEDMEPVRLRALKKENDLLAQEIADLKETVEIFKGVIAKNAGN